MKLYVIHNSVNDRLYVGVTTRSTRRRWREHLRDCKAGVDRVLYRAMRKHGVEKFSLAVIGRAESWFSLCAMESKLIASLPKGRLYNMTTGGEGRPGCPVSADTRLKISRGHLGKRLSAEHRRKLSAAKMGKKLPPRTAEHSARISAGLARTHARKRECARITTN